MYGTVARTRVRPEDRQRLEDLFRRQSGEMTGTGFVTSYVLYEDGGDTAWVFAVFEDRESYQRNAQDPAQDARYREYRELLQTEPEWHDGEIVGDRS